MNIKVNLTNDLFKHSVSNPYFTEIKTVGIKKHKCKCSERCQKFIWGGFYNIPDVGGISVACYDRISKNGKLSPYQVMLALKKKN